MEYIIKLNLEVPNGLCINGTVHSYERKNSNEHKISHLIPGTKDEIPGPHYEIEVSTILPQILPREIMKSLYKKESENFEYERDRRLSLVSDRHIEVGSDLRYYMRCPLLHERFQQTMTKLWLAHQAVFSYAGLNINHFESFLKSKKTSLDEWLEDDEDIEAIPNKQRNFIRANRSLFIQAKAFYEQEKLCGKHRSIIEYVADSTIKALDATVSISLKKYAPLYVGWWVFSSSLFHFKIHNVLLFAFTK